MRELQKIKHFGETNIPILSNISLTARYKTIDWKEVSETWEITMYPTQVEDDLFLEKPSTIITPTDKISMSF